jgi:hypothetical protein
MNMLSQALFLNLSLNLSLHLSGARSCSLCHDRRSACRLCKLLKSVAYRPIQQAISSQA